MPQYQNLESYNGKYTTLINGTFTDIISQMSTAILSFAIVVGAVMLTYLLAKRLFSSNPGELKALSGRIIGIAAVVIGILVSYSVLNIIYKNFASANIVFGSLATSSYVVMIASSTNPNTPPAPPVVLASCSDPNIVISQLKSNTVCGSTCSSSNGCRVNDYMSIVKDESLKAGVNYKAIAALICRESGGVATRIGTSAQNGKKDCGLMQINRDSCDATIMDPKTNIQEGVKLFKQKLQAVSSYSYSGGFTKEMLAFASYNCCSNGTIPSAPSVDCTTASGFPFSIPKWACPINPGESVFNMCKVRDYACDVAACMDRF